MVQDENKKASCGLGTPVKIAALSVMSSAFVWLFLIEAHFFPNGIDDIGLFNPVYMFTYYGVLTYPVYNNPLFMIVHPPLHYLVIGVLMEAGIPLVYALEVPTFLLVLIGVVLIVYSRFPDFAKVAFLFGFVGSCLIPLGVGASSYFMMRPDVDLALAWFAGLMGLESARLSNWELRRLFIGSLLLTCASALHYTAIVAWTGVLVYLGWATRQLGWSKGRRPIVAMLAGVALIGIPYVLLWLIPFRTSIISYVESARPIGGVVSSFSAHLKSYEFLYTYFSQNGMARVIFYPLHVGVLTTLLSLFILLRLRMTRGIAVASLPHVLFITLLLQRKQVSYLLPELMLYLSAFALFAFQIADWGLAQLSRHWLVRASHNRQWTMRTLTVILIVALIVGTPWLQGTHFSPVIDEFPIARAAGRQILGPNAMVGAELAEWYMYGEAYWFMINPYVISRPIDGRNLTNFFGESDAFGMSSLPVNQDASGTLNQTLSLWYADGLLNLRGFYYSTFHSALSYLLLSREKPERVIGYGALPDWQIMRFEQQSDGSYVFAALACDVGFFKTLHTSVLFRDDYLLPRNDHGPRRELVTFVATKMNYGIVRASVLHNCLVREEVPLTMQLQDYHELLQSLSNDKLIKFYPNVEDALDARRLVKGTFVFYDDFSADRIGSEPADWAVYEGNGTGVDVVSCSELDFSGKCVRIADKSETAYCEISPIRGLGNISTVEVLIRPAQSNKPLNFYGNTPEGNVGIELAFTEDGTIDYYSGSDWHRVAPYRANNWYDIRLTRTLFGTYDVYINNSLRAQSLQIRGADSIHGITFQTYPSVAGGVWYVGWVRISYVPEGPPIPREPSLEYQALVFIGELLFLCMAYFWIRSPNDRSRNLDRLFRSGNNGR